MAHVIRCEPFTIAELKTVVKEFAVNMSEEEVRKMVRNTKKRTDCADIMLEDILTFVEKTSMV